jgi:hypothetical protein
VSPERRALQVHKVLRVLPEQRAHRAQLASELLVLKVQLAWARRVPQVRPVSPALLARAYKAQLALALRAQQVFREQRVLVVQALLGRRVQQGSKEQRVYKALWAQLV